MQGLINRCTLKAHAGPIGIGLIGVGGWGRTNAANIMRTRRFNIVGIYDADDQVAKRFAQRHRVKIFASSAELCARTDIQAVCITTPNPYHEKLIRAAAEAGKHIFIEKPLASYPDQCEALGHSCRKRKIILQVGHQMRHDPVFRTMHTLIEQQKTGRPLFAQAVYTLDRKTRSDWRNDRNACPGGSMEQLGVHFIDTLIYLFGSLSNVSPVSANGTKDSEPTKWSTISLQFDSGLCGVVSTSFSAPSHRRFEVFCESGHIWTDGVSLWIDSGDTTPKKQRISGMPGGMAQFHEFADCIEHGKDPESGAKSAAAVMRAVACIHRDTEHQP